MKIKPFRPQFLVFFLRQDPKSWTAEVQSLESASYPVKSFFTPETLLHAIQEDPPHLILIDARNGDFGISDFCARIRQLSDEIQVIALAEVERSLEMQTLVQEGVLRDFIAIPWASSLEVLNKLDRALEGFLLRAAVETSEPDSDAGELTASTELESDLLKWMQSAEQAPNLARLQKSFVEWLSEVLFTIPVGLFQLNESRTRFQFICGAWLPEEKLTGLGFAVQQEHLAALQNSETPEPLVHFVEKTMQLNRLQVFPIQHDGEITGLILALRNHLTDQQRQRIEHGVRIFHLRARLIEALIENHRLKIHDEETGFLHHQALVDRVEQAIASSRRTALPLAAVFIELDHMDEIRESVPPHRMKSLFKHLAKILNGQVRRCDILGRVGPKTFVWLMPHTALDSAVIAAERVHRLLRGARWSPKGLDRVYDLSVTCGVSEYPTVCHDWDSLVRTADEAIVTAQAQGGGYVGVAAAPGGFAPDFEPIRFDQLQKALL